MQDPDLGIPELAPHYFPLYGGPTGHNLYDPMYPWAGGATPASVLNNEAIGVSYVGKSATPDSFVAIDSARAMVGIKTIVPDSPYAD